MTTSAALKLPKELLDHPQHDEVVALFAEAKLPLWEESKYRIPSVPPSRALGSVLARAAGTDLAVQGLEQITKFLIREQKGLAALAAKTPDAPPGARISRVLFVSEDGSERFYRECESLLAHHSERMLVCRIEATGEELGQAVFGAPKLVRAILLTDKKATAQALLALVGN